MYHRHIFLHKVYLPFLTSHMQLLLRRGAATNTDNTVLLETTSRHLAYVIWKLYYTYLPTYIYRTHWVARWILYVNTSDIAIQKLLTFITYMWQNFLYYIQIIQELYKYWARPNEFKGILVCYHSKWQQLWRENFLLKLLALILNGYCPSERRRVVVKRKLSRDLKCNLKKWSRRW